MLTLYRDLVSHKGHANAALLTAIGEHAAAAADHDILALLHHVLLANRFWLSRVLDRPFDHDEESRPAASFTALVQRYADLQSEEAVWIESATESELARVLTSPLIPHGSCFVSEALMQVCLHSHGHRAQLAKMLRRLGGTPPANEFISWVGTRPHAEWPLPGPDRS